MSEETQLSILVLNGPNLNMLGVREPEVYGYETLADLENLCQGMAKDLGLVVTCQQSNNEGDLVTLIQQARGQHHGIVINAAAYTHTSIAILDALKLSELPVIEVHLSNIHAREPFRQHSYISPVAKGVICGMGTNGYAYALHGMKSILTKDTRKKTT